MVAGFIPEWWPTSNRNGGRLRVGKGGRNKSEFAALLGCHLRPQGSDRKSQAPVSKIIVTAVYPEFPISERRWKNIESDESVMIPCWAPESLKRGARCARGMGNLVSQGSRPLEAGIETRGPMRAKDRQQAALAAVAAQSQAMFEHAEAFAASLARDLERCAAIQAVVARELDPIGWLVRGHSQERRVYDVNHRLGILAAFVLLKTFQTIEFNSHLVVSSCDKTKLILLPPRFTDQKPLVPK